MSLYRYTVGRGPAVVLLHGWGMNAAVWEPLLPDMAEHFRVTVLELPGHGGSDVANAADLAEWTALCQAVAPKRAYWVGWSLGGQLALHAAMANPMQVSGVSLVASTPRFVESEDWRCAMPRKTFEQFADALGRDAHATLLRFVALQVKGSEHARNTLRVLQAELEQRPEADPRGLAQGLALLLTTDLRARLGALACRTHWLFGDRDTLVPTRLQGALREMLPDARIDVIEGAGHAPFLSHPQETLAALNHAIAGS